MIRSKLPKKFSPEAWTEAQRFAQHQQVNYQISKFPESLILSRHYQGCQLEISFFKGNEYYPFRTQCYFSVIRQKALLNPRLDQAHTRLKVAQFLEAFIARTFTIDLPGTLQIAPGGKFLFYEESILYIETNSLQALCNTMVRLLKMYPYLVSLGTLAVPTLQEKVDMRHPFQPVARQLLYDIATETQNRLEAEAERLLCPACLQRCIAYHLELSLLEQLTYYGCRACGQSREFMATGRGVIALLDRQMTQKYVRQDGFLYINWLLLRQRFDFDQVYIQQATDEDVERFAIQVGNDTDPWQKPRYANMRCLVWPDAGLSENSLKILKRTFGQVEFMTQDRQKLREIEGL